MDEPRASELSADALHALDARFKAVITDVSVPPELATRLKATLQARYLLGSHAESSDTQTLSPAGLGSIAVSAAAEAGNSPARDGNVQPSNPSASMADEARSGVGDDSGGWLRRSFLAAALAASVGGFAVLANRWTRPAEPAWLAQQSNAIMEQLENDNLANWRRITQAPAGVPAAVKSQLARLAYVAERPLSAFSAKVEGDVYRLDAGDGRGIFLLKMQSLPQVRGLSARFEILPTPSGGWSFAAMTVGEETYVLAAACTEQQMFNYIRRLAVT